MKKHKLLSTCINLLKEPAKELLKESKPTVCHFSLYVSEKLAKFDRRTRAIAEHRISNQLFDLEINSTPAFPNTTSIANDAIQIMQQHLLQQKQVPNNNAMQSVRGP